MPHEKRAMSPEEIARLGGSVNSPAQHAARAKNARRAGRPGRICRRCGKRVQIGKLAVHDACGLWTWQTPAERKRLQRERAAAARRRR